MRWFAGREGKGREGALRRLIDVVQWGETLPTRGCAHTHTHPSASNWVAVVQALQQGCAA
jgi:hypothetical protein